MYKPKPPAHDRPSCTRKLNGLSLAPLRSSFQSQKRVRCADGSQRSRDTGITRAHVIDACKGVLSFRYGHENTSSRASSRASAFKRFLSAFASSRRCFCRSRNACCSLSSMKCCVKPAIMQFPDYLLYFFLTAELRSLRRRHRIFNCRMIIRSEIIALHHLLVPSIIVTARACTCHRVRARPVDFSILRLQLVTVHCRNATFVHIA